MHDHSANPQVEEREPRNQTVAVRCTGSEKRAVQLLATVLDIPESDVMRDRTMADILTEAEQQRLRLARAS